MGNFENSSSADGTKNASHDFQYNEFIRLAAAATTAIQYIEF